MAGNWARSCMTMSIWSEVSPVRRGMRKFRCQTASWMSGTARAPPWSSPGRAAGQWRFPTRSLDLSPWRHFLCSQWRSAKPDLSLGPWIVWLHCLAAEQPSRHLLMIINIKAWKSMLWMQGERTGIRNRKERSFMETFQWLTAWSVHGSEGWGSGMTKVNSEGWIRRTCPQMAVGDRCPHWAVLGNPLPTPAS